MKNFILNQIKNSYEIKKSIYGNPELIGTIQKVCEIIIQAYKRGNKTLIAGNGGSAADAQHMAAEFVNRFYFNRPALSSIALTTDTSILTAISNDCGFEKVFARQIESNGIEGDVFIGISTSGNSKNIIEALKVCKEKGMVTVGLTCESGGRMEEFCDYCIKIPSKETPRIQESHILIGHIICAAVEEAIYGKGFGLAKRG